MKQFSGNLDAYYEPDDEPVLRAMTAGCPKCHGTAKAVGYKVGTVIDADGHPEAEMEITGIDCEECGHREGDECDE
jgi:hypothetical protein